MKKKFNQRKIDDCLSEDLIEIAIPPGVEGERLDRVLANAMPSRSRSFLKKLIEEGRLRRDDRLGRTIKEPSYRVKQGELFFLEIPEVVDAKPNGEDIRGIRGKEISMIFQEPMTSLSPVHTVGNQLVEAILTHKTENKKEAQQFALHMLDRVGIPNPAERLKAYPFQLSGGMRQRVMIAMALSCNPKLLFADEPTGNLDIVTGAKINDLLFELNQEQGTTLVIVTHEQSLAARCARRLHLQCGAKFVSVEEMTIKC